VTPDKSYEAPVFIDNPDEITDSDSRQTIYREREHANPGTKTGKIFEFLLGNSFQATIRRCITLLARNSPLDGD
jgi:hypothetical protein